MKLNLNAERKMKRKMYFFNLNGSKATLIDSETEQTLTIIDDSGFDITIGYIMTNSYLFRKVKSHSVTMNMLSVSF
jgi:hypothetical protein